jgi:arsenate reductase (thioredoxin)
MTKRVRNVLFLCTGNSARSILAEAILNARGAGRFRAFSAGSMPAGRVNPYAIELLERHRLPVSGLRSKSWDEFAAPGAPGIDFVFTVCDNAAAESCPVWPGRPATAHWGVDDPAAVEGSADDKRLAFHSTYAALATRIEAFLQLPIDRIDPTELEQRLHDIGAAGSRPDAC